MKKILLRAFDSLIEELIYLIEKCPVTNGHNRKEFKFILEEAITYRDAIEKSNIEEVQIVIAKTFYERHGYKVMI